MSFKKFLAPNIVALLVLAALWVSGIDSVTIKKNTDRENIQKYIQVEKKIIDNYVDPINVNKLYQNSIRNMVVHLPDSLNIKVAGTPLDTTFKNVHVNDLRESVLHFEKAYVFLSNNYPKVSLDKSTANAIRGMFINLDPHSIYITPEENKRVGEEFSGKFQGIGVQFDIINDTITVITPLSGGPSAKLGIESGDKIVTIDDSTAIGFSNEQVIKHLRGPKGSVVKVGIKRPHINHLLSFNITRDDIPLYTIDTSYMLDNETGYIKINRFARTTHQEFMEAVSKLKKDGMKRLVLDLRNNPGGFLDQALRIANEFYPRGVKLLSTKSRHIRYDQVFRTTYNGSLEHTPLIILINEGSASASEIVSGSIQDHDRGLIVGRRSFGKGLVQQQYELVDSSAIRVTISRYYTPSGRLIQKPYKNGREKYAYELMRRSRNAETDAINFIDHAPDSLKYKTDAGRTVYGGGGIIPDHIIQNDTTSSYILGLMRRKNLGIKFVLHYLSNNGKTLSEKYKNDFNGFRKNFHWSPAEVQDFKKYMISNGLVESDTVKKPTFKKGKLYVKPGRFEKEAWIPEGSMKADIAQQLWGAPQFYTVNNDIFDKTLKKAMKLWPEVHSLEKLAEEHNSAGNFKSSDLNK
ncbi:MAG TPA: S41 family peptidase [Balneolales bacterium]|nr:S41 family peptidase [Balneolales bacterium]